jgi:AbrB family looped-hinge helix DNA binding protein
METVTLSSEFTIEIPKRICERLNLCPGDRFQIIEHPSYISLLPIRPIEEFKGALRNVSPDIERDDDRI